MIKTLLFRLNESYDFTPEDYSNWHLSAFTGNVERVRDFISKGIDVNHVDTRNSNETHLLKPLLIAACEYSNLDMVKELLKSPNIDVNAKDTTGATVLYYACGIPKNINIVKELLKRPEIKVNEGSPFMNMTPLMEACNSSSVEIIAELLKHPDIDITIIGNRKRTAFQMARSAKVKQLFKDYELKKEVAASKISYVKDTETEEV